MRLQHSPTRYGNISFTASTSPPPITSPLPVSPFLLPFQLPPAPSIAPTMSIEEQRQARILANRQRLADLGIPDLVRSITDEKKNVTKVKKKIPARPSSLPPLPPLPGLPGSTTLPGLPPFPDLPGVIAPERGAGSARLRGSPAEFDPSRLPVDHELYVPPSIKSGVILQGQDDDHDDDDDPTKYIPSLASREDIHIERDMMEEEKMAHRMTKVDIGGLIELSLSKAAFIVFGSPDRKTGRRNHYTITLQDSNFLGSSNARCTCIDYKVRKHNCKHIRRVWSDVGLTEDTWMNWYQAVETFVSSGLVGDADARDVAKYQLQEQNRMVREEKRQRARAKLDAMSYDDREEMIQKRQAAAEKRRATLARKKNKAAETTLRTKRQAPKATELKVKEVGGVGGEPVAVRKRMRARKEKRM